MHYPRKICTTWLLAVVSGWLVACASPLTALPPPTASPPFAAETANKHAAAAQHGATTESPTQIITKSAKPASGNTAWTPIYVSHAITQHH